MTLEKMTKLFNILAEHKKDLTPEQELSFYRKKIGKAERFLNAEIMKQSNEWCQK